MRHLGPRTVYVGILGAQGLARGLLFAALASYWVIDAHLGPLQLVLLGTALEATLFVLQVPTGAFADTAGRRPATVIGYVLLGASLGLQALTRDFAALMALQAVCGAGWAFLIGSQEAWIGEHASPEVLPKVYLRGGQAMTAGTIGGLAITIGLGLTGARLPILIGGGILVFVGVAAWFVMQEDFAPSGHDSIVGAARTGLEIVRRSRTLTILVLVVLGLGMSSEGWDRLYTAHLMTDLGLASSRVLSPVGWLAVIGLANSVLEIGAFELAARQEHAGRLGVMLAGLSGARAVLMVVFATTPWLAFGVAAFIAAETVRSLGQPLLDAWVAQETPAANRATVLSAVGQADSLGQIAVGPLVGLLGAAVSIPAALAASAALLAPTALLALAARRPPAAAGRATDSQS